MCCADSWMSVSCENVLDTVTLIALNQIDLMAGFSWTLTMSADEGLSPLTVIVRRDGVHPCTVDLNGNGTL